MEVRPFVKWAGGKRGLIPTFERRGFFPKKFKDYYEPMVGAGAVFFHIAKDHDPRRCILSDVNPDLIDTYRVIKEEPEDLIDELDEIKKEYLDLDDQKGYYYDRRDEFNRLKLEQTERIRKSALFIFLNKTCFNGLYRVNKKGEFNVPFGKRKNPGLYDKKNIMNISELLKKDDVMNVDFEEAVKDASEGDFVYFDPPYVPLTETAAFTSYAKHDFGLEEQKRLARVVNELAERGCFVMESNSGSEIVEDIYEGYERLELYPLMAPRQISCKGDERQPVKEYVIVNYEPRGMVQKKLTRYE